MDVKPGSKSGTTAGMKPPSSDSNVNMSMVNRIDQVLDEEKNRREQLSRRPSYRKILKELGGSKAVNTSEQLAASDEDGEDGLSGEESPSGPANNGNQPHKLPVGAKQLATSSSSSQQPTTGASVILLPHALASAGNTHSPALRNTRSPNNGTQTNSFEVHDAAAVAASSSASSNIQLSSALASSHHFVGLIPAGLNMVQMEGASQQLGTLLANAAQPAAILQYAQQGLDGQLYIPAAANMQAYQVAAAASANSAAFSVSNTQPLFVTTAPSGSTSAGSSNSPVGAPHGGGGDDSTRKREMRLLKNREAARECRRKKKEYVKCLENRVAVLESQNKTLIEELKALKELYCSKDAPTGSGQPPSAATVPQS